MTPNKEPVNNLRMTPVAWAGLSVFAGIVAMLAAIYLFAIKTGRDKKRLKQVSKADTDTA